MLLVRCVFSVYYISGDEDQRTDAMAVHGTLSAFNPQEEDWSEYAERLSFYFTANGITTDAKKRAILLSSVGPSTFRLMRSLVLPESLDSVSFDDLVKKVKEHKEPPPSVIVRRFQFNTRNQKPGETFSEYVAVLRKAAEHCNFGNSLNEMLRDRLVCGIANGTVQKRLLAEKELTLDKAISLAQSVEIAEKGAKDLQLPTATKSSDSPLLKLTKRSEDKGTDKPKSCYRCGGKHLAPQCRFKSEVCRSCGKTGHIAKVCRTKPPDKKTTDGKPCSYVTQDSDTEYQLFDSDFQLFVVDTASSNPLKTTLHIEGHDLTMEIDTGAAVSLVSEHTVNNSFLKDLPCHQTSVRLRTYTGESVAVLGKLLVTVKTDEANLTLPLLVVKGSGTTLLGRDWLQQLRLNWKNIFSFHSLTILQQVLDCHQSVFTEELGTFNKAKVKFYLKEDAKPQFLKARQVPFALRDRVSAELDRLEAAGIITPTKFSHWATPIVPIVKKDGSIRICGDFKQTVNKFAKTEIYPLPRIEELFATLSGGKTFTTLDLSHAYLQLELEDESQELVTINTSKGLYKYKRLPFGVASAPAVFQRTMETTLQGIPMVCVYLDDILISGKTDQEHLANLNEVLTRLEAAGLRLKKEKCSFCESQVTYLGHIISAEGLKPSPNKLRAVSELPVPSKVTELKTFLGLVNYYAKFLPDLANRLAPLYKLLQHGEPWNWSTQQETAFQDVKKSLLTPQVLAHFDDTKPIVLACDASPFGLGAVLSQIFDDGSEHPVAFASRSLSRAERNYAHIDKEALAIIFGIGKFHQYISGRAFTLFTDHKPLIHIFNESKSVPVMASARLQRWALTLSGYHYSIKFKSGNRQGNADALSRFPLSESPPSVPIPPETVTVMEHLSQIPLTSAKLRQQIDRDATLSKVKRFTKFGWPTQLESHDDLLKPFFNRRHELSLEDNVLLWGNRVVIPPCSQCRVLDLLHSTHIGVSRMKSLARQYVWWPKIDSDIDVKVKNCSTCAVAGPTPPPTVLHPWEWPKQPWSRVHLDYAGPFLGKMFLVIVDSHSKWIDIHLTNNSTTATTIEKLQFTFASLGLPEIIVTDNGPSFASSEFSDFAKSNGIQHVKTVPYHPAANGLAERAVQTFKACMKKLSQGTLQDRINAFLFKYRTTPQTTTGITPAELLMGRKLRTHLDLLVPDVGERVRKKQSLQKHTHDLHAKDKLFQVNDPVLAKNFSTGPPWITGKILRQSGATTFFVELPDGRVVRRHPNQLKPNTSESQVSLQSDNVDEQWIPAPVFEPTQSDAAPPPPDTSSAEPRRSGRIRHPPNRFLPDSV